MLPKDDNLVEELELSNLPQDQQALYVEQFYDTLKKRLLVAIEDRLNEEQLKEFEQVDEGNEEALTAWITKVIPDYDQLVSDETAALKADIKKTAHHLQKTIDESA